MVTLTFNMFGLTLAGISIFMGLAVPMASNEGDNWIGVAYAASVIAISIAMYLLGVGADAVFGS